jgi:tetratricopeptide (TPR) repeat protein
LLANQKLNRKASEKNRSPEEVFQDELKELSLRFQTVAEFYSTHGDLRKSEQVARRALVLDANHQQPKVLLMDLLQNQDRIKESLAFADQLCLTDKENPRWPYTRGALLSLLGDRVAARQAYEEVVKLAPTSPTGYEALARMAIGTREGLKSAIAFAQKTVEVRGSAADHELLAQAYAINSDFPKAHQSLSEAMRLDPSNRGYVEAMEQLQRAMGNPK